MVVEFLNYPKYKIHSKSKKNMWDLGDGRDDKSCKILDER
jgi:hypothetical protein